LNVVQEGIPDLIPVAACHLCRQQSFAKLAMLAAPNIKGQERAASLLPPVRPLAFDLA
jgi:hypothetical protein